MVAGLEVPGLDRRREGEGDAVEDRRDEPVLERVVADSRPLEGARDLGRELFRGERLDQHPRGTVAQGPDRVIERRVPGGDDDRDLLVPSTDRGEERVAIHPGHPDVGDDQVESLGVEQRQCGNRAVGGRRDQAHPFEQPGDERKHLRLVIDAEHPRPCGTRRGALGHAGIRPDQIALRGSIGDDDRKADLDRRPNTLGAVEPDRPSMTLDEAEAHGQPEPGSAGADSTPRGKERNEGSCGDHLVHPHPIVRDRHDCIGSADRGLDPQRAAIWHRLHGIRQDVQDHLLNRLRIERDERQLGLRLGDDNPGLCEREAHQLGHPHDEVRQICRCKLGFTGPREVAERPHDRAGPQGRLANRLHVLPARVARIEVLEQDLGEAEDRRQRVVHLVGDARRELADSRQSRGADEVGLDAFALQELFSQLADQSIVLPVKRPHLRQHVRPLPK